MSILQKLQQGRNCVYDGFKRYNCSKVLYKLTVISNIWAGCLFNELGNYIQHLNFISLSLSDIMRVKWLYIAPAEMI